MLPSKGVAPFISLEKLVKESSRLKYNEYVCVESASLPSLSAFNSITSWEYRLTLPAYQPAPPQKK